MSKDVKIEIIYFKSDTDVSLEFGLHGNYPVRLLSSSSNNLSEFFNLLKRAVSRSEIIITVGGYSNDEFLPKFIARAINKELVIPDYNKQGIMANEKFELPKGANPLSSKGKYFGGFLIESGPQTIISLTDNREIRLDIVNNIIVKYIEEHHNFFANGYSVLSNEISEQTQSEESLNIFVKDNHSEIPTEFEEISSTSEPLNTQKVDLASDDNPIEPEIVIEQEISVPNETFDAETHEENSVKVDTSKIVEPENTVLDSISPDDFDFDVNNNPESKTKKQKTKKTRPQRRFLRVMCIILSLLIIICTSVTVFVLKRNDVVKTDADGNYYSTLAELYQSFGNNFEGAFNALSQYNNDINAWLSLYGTNLNFPVIKTVITYNFYHNHLPNGNENIMGTIYTSNNVGNDVLYQNNVLYGSAESGLGVFSAIVDLFDNTELNEISKLLLSNKHGLTEWQIFSLFTENEAEGFVFEVSDFDNEIKYEAFVKQLIRHNRTQLKAVLNDSTAPVITMIAVDGNKRYIACATPYYNVSFIEKENVNSENVEDDLPDNLVDVNDNNVLLDDKTEENAGDFEQSPINPDNVVVLPPVSVTPPSSTTSSNNSTTSSNVSSSSKQETTSNTTSSTTSSNLSSNTSSSVSSDTSSVTSSNTSSTTSNITSSVTSSTTSNVTSSNVSSDVSDITSSENSSDVSSNISSSTSSNTSSTSSETLSSETSSNNSSITSSDSTSSDSEVEQKPTIDPIYTWDITFYVKQSNGIIYGPATDIVARVIESEMGVAFPLEALKAQAVATYAWLINNGAMKQSSAPSGVPMKNPSARAIQAVSEVKGVLLTYNNAIANAFYFAYSAGYTSNIQDVWTAKLPYLQGVECSVDTNLPYFISTKTYKADDLRELIYKKCEIDVSELDKNEWIKPIEYDNNNTYCTYVEIGGVRYRGVFVRNTLLSNGIRSTAFTITYDEETDSFTFTCKGWGHGVGMSQEGAKAYAKQGWSYEQILAHFYTGTTLIKN